MSPVLESKGALLERYGVFSVFAGFPFNWFEVTQPVFSPSETRLLESLSSAAAGRMGSLSLQQDWPGVSKAFLEQFSSQIVREIGSAEAMQKMPSMAELQGVKQKLAGLLAKNFSGISNAPALANEAVERAIGFGVLAPLLSDGSLEEIMVNGTNQPVFVVHRKFGMCKTNIVFLDEKDLNRLVVRIAFSLGKAFDESAPLLDARLSDGSRVNATYSDVTPGGATLTIRKFSRIPLSMANLVQSNTLSSQAAAFLWVMIEGLGLEPQNVIVTGGTSSGKTTTLNALAQFSRFSDRIVSIEDTLELDLGTRENWVRMESRPKTRTSAGVSMDELLKNSMRMRPDRIIVGEVRGFEAQTMFVAMDTGHRGLMGTLHSNSAREMILRLKEEPMNVAESMIPMLNLAVVQVKLFLPGKGVVRRVLQIAEIASLDGKPLISNLFEWDRKTDLLKQTDVPSHTLETFSERTSLSKNELKREMLVRQRLLEWLIEKGISSNADVQQTIQQYYADPESLLKKVSKE